MKFVLFCVNNYAFGILEPIQKVLEEKGHTYLWYVAKKIEQDFPYKSQPNTSKVTELETFKPDAIFVPGNEVPYYVRGWKVQVFHGLAGEKKGHFRIRQYFDLYLTQGPYFTNKFNELKATHKNFDVIETGWPKLDVYGTHKDSFMSEKGELLKQYSAKKIVLYAPTFSPKLTSAPHLLNEIKLLSQHKEYLILIKFHPLMDNHWVNSYKALTNDNKNIIVKEDKNIIKLLLMADIMISDTSSVVYEFLLLDKPVITFNSISKNISWHNVTTYTNLPNLVSQNLESDPFAEQRAYTNKNFHPYNDGKSALRMVEAVEEYIKKHGVPEKRKLSFLRRMKIHKHFGKPTS